MATPRRRGNAPTSAEPTPAPRRRRGPSISYNAGYALSQSVSRVSNLNLQRVWRKTGPNTPPNRSNRMLIRGVTPLNQRTKSKLIIKWGPPASGKGSSLVKAAITRLGDPMSSYWQFGVDDAIEFTNYFKTVSQALAKERFGNVNNINKMMNNLNGISNTNAKAFGKPYTNVRIAENSRGNKMSNKLNFMIKAAIAARENITFETTGTLPGVTGAPRNIETPWPAWIWRNSANSFFSHYNLIIVFPIVPFKETWRRYRMRAISSYKRGEGFRFASSKNQLKNSYQQSYTTFLRNLINADKMARVSKVIVLPYNKPAIEWNPQRVAGGRSPQRQAILNLVREYMEESKIN